MVDDSDGDSDLDMEIISQMDENGAIIGSGDFDAETFKSNKKSISLVESLIERSFFQRKRKRDKNTSKKDDNEDIYDWKNAFMDKVEIEKSLGGDISNKIFNVVKTEIDETSESSEKTTDQKLKNCSHEVEIGNLDRYQVEADICTVDADSKLKKETISPVNILVSDSQNQIPCSSDYSGCNPHAKPPNNEYKKMFNVVADMARCGPTDFRSATFRGHGDPTKKEKLFYSTKPQVSTNGNVIQIGKQDQSSSDNFDYAVAVVNKRTGKAEYFSTQFVTFKAVFSAEHDAYNLEKSQPHPNYLLENKGATEMWAEKRRALTDEFGSAKKMKILDNAKRRQVKDETLTTMMNSAFASPDMTKKQVTDEKVASISLLNQAQSSVLPVANEDAKLPCDVYSLTQFASKVEIDELNAVAAEFVQSSKEKICETKFAKLIFEHLGGFQHDNERNTYLLLLATMIHFYKVFGKPSKRYMTASDLSQIPFPLEFVNKVRYGFFSTDSTPVGRDKVRISINASNKDKLLAHIICLGLILDVGGISLPVTPWSKELQASETKITKIATALGCVVISVSPGDGIRLGTTRLVRLKGQPFKKARAEKVFRRKR